MSTEDKISSDELTDLIGRVRVSFGGFEDADALIAEAEQFVARLAEVEAERDAARAEAAAALESLTALAPSSLGAQLAHAEAELERYQSESRMFAADCTRLERALEAARPVVERAQESIAEIRNLTGGNLNSAWVSEHTRLLAAAVDLYRSATTRNLDSARADPSLAAETLPTTEEKP